MLFTSPKLRRDELDALTRIDDLYDRLRYAASAPKRWGGILRREAFAGAIRGSIGIEGHNVSIEDAVAAIDNEEPVDAKREDWLANVGYRNAMTYVMQLAEDPYFEFSEALIRSLHYMMLSYDLSKRPGQWRSGPIAVRNEASGEIVYDAPDGEHVPVLMKELVAFLTQDVETRPVIRAAMAHLNLVLIHPFADGNGRMGRALQTLTLVRGGLTSPVFSSIEQWLGANTQGYYDVLVDVSAGRWNPERDARPWIRFCLRAHFECANRFLSLNQMIGRMWDEIERLIKAHKLPERTDFVLVWAALGRRARNATYRNMADVSEAIASRDLKRLTDCGLLTPRGEKRGRFYVATDILKQIARKADTPAPTGDPFAPYEPPLPGLK